MYMYVACYCCLIYYNVVAFCGRTIQATGRDEMRSPVATPVYRDPD